jgi:flagellar FliL protein
MDLQAVQRKKMATAQKAAPKVVVPIDDTAEAPPLKSPKKKLILVLAILLLVLGGGGASAWLLLSGDSNASTAQANPEQPKPPVFLPIEQFTLNLQSSGNGTIDQYLQIAFTLQVADQEQIDQIKAYMPLLRSRLLMLLSSKKAADISSADGKKKLQEEILAQVKEPFLPQSAPQEVSGVFFTSFVIQ